MKLQKEKRLGLSKETLKMITEAQLAAEQPAGGIVSSDNFRCMQTL